MSRIWTSRKTTTFQAGALPAGAAPPYPLDRAEFEPAAAVKRALRFLTGYALLFLPLHLFVCFLSMRAPALTSLLVLTTAAGLLLVSLARWLSLDDLLQQLPILAVLALVGIGFVVLTSQSMPRAFRGTDFLGSLFIFVIVASVLGSLYKPMAVAYQTVTQRTPVRDLFIAAGALLLSLLLALAAHALPRFALWPVAGLMCGCLSGLILLEFAAWARANPKVGLERVIAFEKEDERRKQLDPRGALIGGTIFGLAFGLMSVVTENLPVPSADFTRFVNKLGSEPNLARVLLGEALALGISGMVFGFVTLGRSLGAVKPGHPIRAIRYAGQAIVVFLSYPDVKHPLIHRLRVEAVRSPAVRGVLFGLSLITVATAFFTPADKMHQSEAAAPRQTAPREETPRDADFNWPAAQPAGPWAWQGEVPLIPMPLPPAPPPPPPAPKGEEVSVLGLLDKLAGYAFGPLLFLAAMVFYLGLGVLPTYGCYFEPRPSSP